MNDAIESIYLCLSFYIQNYCLTAVLGNKFFGSQAHTAPSYIKDMPCMEGLFILLVQKLT